MICPKCGILGKQTVEYHTGDHNTHSIGVVAFPGCGDKMYNFNTSKVEHLHFYCTCGYDWVQKTEDNK